MTVIQDTVFKKPFDTAYNSKGKVIRFGLQTSTSNGCAWFVEQEYDVCHLFPAHGLGEARALFRKLTTVGQVSFPSEVR